MKNKYLLLLGVGVLCASNSFATLNVTLTQNTSAYSGENGGGEFMAVTSGNGTFQTFCIDVGHEFYSGGNYNYTISQQNYVGSGNNISVGTAWLYSQFLGQTLSGYTFADGSANATSATMLQSVFWGLEGEFYGSSSSYFDSSNPFYNAVINHFVTLDAAKVDAGANNIYGVAVMNLYSGSDPSKNLAQSQLIQIPRNSDIPPSIPEPSTVVAGALLLLPFGVSAFKIVRRKNAAQN
jgi:hypothetical protein